MATKATSTKTASASRKEADDTPEVQPAPNPDLQKVNPLQIIAIADAVFDPLEKTLDAIDEAKKSGANITPEQQTALQNRYHSLRDRTDNQFTGDHWQLPPP